MEHFYRHVAKHRHIIIAIFLVLAAVSFWARSKVNVDYDMNDYLPASSASTIALDTMQSEFSTAIPNCRVMLRRVDEKTALAYKKKIAAVDGVTAVVIFAILVVPAYVMSTQNSYYFGSSHIFSAGTTYGDDTTAIQKVFGKTDTYVLMVPKDDEAKERALAKAVKKLDHVTSVTDMTTMVGPAVPTEMLPEKLTGQLESKHYRRMVIAVRANYEGTQTFNLVKRIRKTAETYYPDKWLLAGEGVSTYDMMDTVTADMQKVNFVAIAAVFIVLLITMRSLLLPALLVLTIETAIWINFSIPHLTGTPIFYIAYLIISSIQLGATVDYAIYLTGHYKENRTSFVCGKKHAVVKTVSECLPSVLTSGTVLALVGLILGAVSSHGVLKEIGHFLGIGTVLSLIMVLTVLPGLLYLADRFVVGKQTRTTPNPNDE
ncbi:MAG: MMPL family transporter [Pseudoramibacter sp.]|jgi:predicted RND superfamily exporter protein